MKRLTTLAVLLLGVGLLASAALASAKKPAVYRHYVACGLSQKAKPAHKCRKGRKKGAFFRSNKADVFYTVCVSFPTKKHLCAPKQEAMQGTLYVNEITSNIVGKHQVTWFVKGKRVGRFIFTVVPKGSGGHGNRTNRRKRSRRDYDCSDFKTHAAAQRFFERHHPGRDPFNLDGDGDGKACESLP